MIKGAYMQKWILISFICVVTITMAAPLGKK